MKKRIIFIIFITLFVFLGIYLGNLLNLNESKIFKLESCGDGTFYNTCSLNKPYYCFGGVLIEKASICGCTEFFDDKSGESCTSDLNSGKKIIDLKYNLNGHENSISFLEYKEVSDYVSNLSRSINYETGEKFSRADFKLQEINEDVQREFLIPLVVEIQNKADNKEDQARIAISIVQNIPYSFSDKFIDFKGANISYSRYPYEVLYNFQGICEEKTALLAFLLRELDYGLVIFYYPKENHEALGIKCPVEYSLNNTGYCFVETTSPAIISDDKEYYKDSGYLLDGFEIYLISDGISLPENMYEYNDANNFAKLNKIIKEKGRLNFFRSKKYDEIKARYGL